MCIKLIHPSHVVSYSLHSLHWHLVFVVLVGAGEEVVLADSSDLEVMMLMEVLSCRRQSPPSPQNVCNSCTWSPSATVGPLYI